MTIKVGEVGKLFICATGFDLSGNTGLDLNFTKPDLTTATVSNPRVTAPGVPLVGDPFLGNVDANTYMQFTIEAADFDQAGTWRVCCVYTDGTPKIFKGDNAVFTVEPDCV